MTLQAAHSASEDEPTAARSESDDDDDLTRLWPAIPLARLSAAPATLAAWRADALNTPL